ncbi:MAG TPA: N-acetyl-gamma-glutamyl-phosphate reductase, partial [bacterium]|nr:N-acetyl-gamma-glutamyl-phosphate reductase [bacterium]
MKAAVLGATGYTGQILLRILAEHSSVTKVIAVSSSQAGNKVRSVDPGLPPCIEEKIPGGVLADMETAVRAAQARELDVVFSALPHLTSAKA